MLRWFRGSIVGGVFGLLLLLGLITTPLAAQEAAKPNILWITCEDISPNLGCYGDDYAVTPNLDRLATQGVRYTHAFAPIGVCAPARSCLITGMYPPSLGSQHMRCQIKLPAAVRCFPEYLRKAGYYCTNNSKKDYNFNEPKATWDASGRNAHWKKRRGDQPFFSVFNFTTCHESQIRLPEARYQQRTRDYNDNERHDPDQAPVPPYHPNTPEVRKDWARYADMVTFMDRQVGNLLKELEADGLADDTIVFFYSDHGAGMPRSKRWLYDSSTRVPLIIRCPAKWRHLVPGEPGSTSDRLVSFVDFGPTVLSLAGIERPKPMQGKPFLGKHAMAPRKYIYGYRDRMDERYDLIRCVRDQQFKYIRNYMPQLPYFHHQHISYMYQMPTMQVWQRLADAGKLEGANAVFMALSKPTEELYDTEADPHEVNNLAAEPAHQETLKRLRAEHRRWMKKIIDLGLLPEPDLRSRFGNTPPYTAVRANPERYPFDRIASTADLANARDPEQLAKLTQRLDDADPAVRFWAATGLGSLPQVNPAAKDALVKRLEDTKPFVQVAAANAMCRLGAIEQALPTLINAMDSPNEWTRLQAINVLDRLDARAANAEPVLRQALKDSNRYVQRVAQHAVKGGSER